MAGYKITKEVEVRPGQFYREYAGASTDVKPAHDEMKMFAVRTIFLLFRVQNIT